MKSYTVSYRVLGEKTWIEITDIIADGLTPGTSHRFFVDSTGVRYEIPIYKIEFKFSKERSEMIAAQTEAAKT